MIIVYDGFDGVTMIHSKKSLLVLFSILVYGGNQGRVDSPIIFFLSINIFLVNIYNRRGILCTNI